MPRVADLERIPSEHEYAKEADSEPFAGDVPNGAVADAVDEAPWRIVPFGETA